MQQASLDCNIAHGIGVILALWRIHGVFLANIKFRWVIVGQLKRCRFKTRDGHYSSTHLLMVVIGSLDSNGTFAICLW